MDDFPQRLRQVMAEMGLSQRKFSWLIGVSDETVRNWLNGATPSAAHLRVLAVETGKSADWWLGLSDDHQGERPGADDGPPPGEQDERKKAGARRLAGAGRKEQAARRQPADRRAEGQQDR